MVGDLKMEFQPILPVWAAAAAAVVVMAILVLRLLRGKMELRYRVASFVRLTLIVVLLFGINLRPMREVQDAKAMMKNLDVLFVTDTTVSMWAEDGRGGNTRWSAAQKDCEYIMDELASSNFALIRFSNVSQVLSPFTQDDQIVTDALKTISIPDKFYASGTNLNTPLEDLRMLLESSSKKEGRKTILLFLTDGEITDDTKLSEDYAALSEYIDGGCVMGYGTEKGGRMKDSDGDYVVDPATGKDAVSKLSEDNLKKLAKMLKVDYVHMEHTENVKFNIDRIVEMSSMTEGDKKTFTLEDTYYYLVYPLILLLVWETALLIRKGRL